MQIAEKYLINDLVTFIMWNILIMLISGIIYFIIKEFSRIRNGRISNRESMLIGIFIGFSLLIISLFINFEVKLNEVHSEKSIKNILNPTILYLIFFGVFINKRLILPIMLFLLFALALKGLIFSPTILNPPQLINVFFAFTEIISAAVIVSLIKDNGRFKNLGLKITTTFFIFVSLIVLSEIISTLIIQSRNKPDIITNLALLALAMALIESIYLFVLFSLHWFLFKGIDKIYRNFSELETFMTYDDISYYKLSLAQNELKNIISKKKIQKGILTIFDIKDSKYDIIKILTKIRVETNNLYTSVFFFKVSPTHYGAFYEIEKISDFSLILNNNRLRHRTNNDPLFSLSNRLKMIAYEFKTEITATAAIYGVHSNDINELLEYSQFLMIPNIKNANDNNIIVYDFKRVKNRLKEKIDVLNLPVNVNELEVSFTRGICENNVYYPSISFGKKQTDKLSNIIMRLSNIDELELLLRFVTFQSLRIFKKKDSKLVIYMTSSFFEKDNFVFRDFNKKTSKFLPNNKIIIGLTMSTVENIEKFKLNIQILRKNNYEFCIINPDSIRQNQIDLVNPEYILDIDEVQNPFSVQKKQLLIETDAVRLNTNLV